MSTDSLPVLIAGGGIGGLAAALALVRRGFKVQVFEQAPEVGEIGAGIQLAPNAFHAFDALGVGERTRSRAVYTEHLVMHDALDESLLVRIDTGTDFQQRFGNPYAVIHRVDVHRALLDGALETGRVELFTNARIAGIEQNEAQRTVTVHAQDGRQWTGQALIGADGVRSVVREQYVGDPARVTGHVVYRAVVDEREFPDDLKWNAASIWVGPQCHLVHYPLRGGEQYNVVVTFHSRQQEQWGVTDGSKAEVESYFKGVCSKARQLIELPRSWRRWATADKDPIATWVFKRATLLGDAAHPTTQYMAQGACMALEDAVTLGEALRVSDNDWEKALPLYEKNRVVRTARIVLSGREMGRLFHVDGVERLVRNSLWKGRSQERFYDALEWLFGWNAANSLAQG